MLNWLILIRWVAMATAVVWLGFFLGEWKLSFALIGLYVLLAWQFSNFGFILAVIRSVWLYVFVMLCVLLLFYLPPFWGKEDVDVLPKILGWYALSSLAVECCMGQAECAGRKCALFVVASFFLMVFSTLLCFGLFGWILFVRCCA